MLKNLLLSSVLLSSSSALAGGIVCTTKNILGFPDEYTVTYSPGPTGVYSGVVFARCENPTPGKACTFKPELRFDQSLNETVVSWPIGNYSAKSSDGSTVLIQVTKLDGVSGEYEGKVTMIWPTALRPFENDLACDTLE